MVAADDHNFGMLSWNRNFLCKIHLDLSEHSNLIRKHDVFRPRPARTGMSTPGSWPLNQFCTQFCTILSLTVCDLYWSFKQLGRAKIHSPECTGCMAACERAQSCTRCLCRCTIPRAMQWRHLRVPAITVSTRIPDQTSSHLQVASCKLAAMTSAIQIFWHLLVRSQSTTHRSPLRRSY